MVQALENLAVADGDPVRTGHIASVDTQKQQLIDTAKPAIN